MMTRNDHFKCDYCGKFLKTGDKSAIFEGETLRWDYGREVIYEEYPCYHKKCAVKAAWRRTQEGED